MTDLYSHGYDEEVPEEQWLAIREAEAQYYDWMQQETLDTAAADEASARRAERKNPHWNNQVKIGSGRSDAGAGHRAIDVASKLFDAGVWDGTGILVVHDPYRTHGKMPSFIERGGSFVANLVDGEDYYVTEDSLYRRATAEVALS